MPVTLTTSSQTSEEGVIVPEEGVAPNCPGNDVIFAVGNGNRGPEAVPRQPLKPCSANGPKTMKAVAEEDRWFAFSKFDLLSIVDATLKTMSRKDNVSNTSRASSKKLTSSCDLVSFNQPLIPGTNRRAKENGNAISDDNCQPLEAKYEDGYEATGAPVSDGLPCGHQVRQQLTLTFMAANPSAPGVVTSSSSSDKTDRDGVKYTQSIATRIATWGPVDASHSPSQLKHASPQRCGLHFHERASAPREPDKNNKEECGVPSARQRDGSELSNNTTPCVPKRATGARDTPLTAPCPATSHKPSSTTASWAAFFDGSSALAHNQERHSACAYSISRPCGDVMKAASTKALPTNSTETIMPADLCEQQQDFNVGQVKLDTELLYNTDNVCNSDINTVRNDQYEQKGSEYDDVSSPGSDVGAGLPCSIVNKEVSTHLTYLMGVSTIPVSEKQDLSRDNITSPTDSRCQPAVAMQPGDETATNPCKSLLSELLTTADRKRDTSPVKIDNADSTESSVTAVENAQVDLKEINVAPGSKETTRTSDRYGDKDSIGCCSNDPGECTGGTTSRIDRVKKPRKKRVKSWTSGSGNKGMTSSEQALVKRESECWVALNKSMVYELVDQAMSEDTVELKEVLREARSVITESPSTLLLCPSGDNSQRVGSPAVGVSSCGAAHTAPLSTPRLMATWQGDGEMDQRPSGGNSICAQREKLSSAPREKMSSALRSGCHLDSSRSKMDTDLCCSDAECLDLSLHNARSAEKTKIAGEREDSMLNSPPTSRVLMDAKEPYSDRAPGADELQDVPVDAKPIRQRTKRNRTTDGGRGMSKRKRTVPSFEDTNSVHSPPGSDMKLDVQNVILDENRERIFQHENSEDMSAAKALCVLFMGGCSSNRLRDNGRSTSAPTCDVNLSPPASMSSNESTSTSTDDCTQRQPPPTPAESCQQMIDSFCDRPQARVNQCVSGDGLKQRAMESMPLTPTPPASMYRQAEGQTHLKLIQSHRVTSPKHGWVALSKAEVHTIVDNVVTSMFDQNAEETSPVSAVNNCSLLNKSVDDDSSISHSSSSSPSAEQHIDLDSIRNGDCELDPNPLDRSDNCDISISSKPRTKVRFACIDDLAQGSQYSPDTNDLNAILPICPADDLDESQSPCGGKPFKWKSTMMHRAKLPTLSMSLSSDVVTNPGNRSPSLMKIGSEVSQVTG